MRDTFVQGRHDETGSQHVGVYRPEPGPLTDGSDPTVSGTPVEPLSVAPGQIDCTDGSGNQRDDRRLVALADNP
jgi:hypothetical protein